MLKLAVKKFAAKNREVWDIAVYGSYTRGNEEARDIDFAIILSQKTDAGKKLSFAQQLKESLEKILLFKIDCKTVDFSDFLEPTFLARQGIVSEGYLLIRNSFFANLFGFKTFVLIKYSLKGLTYSRKKMLYYALKGRRNAKGILEKTGGILLSRVLLKVPILAYYEIEQLLKLHKVEFNTEFVMSYYKR